MTVGVYDNRYAARNGCSTDAGNKRVIVSFVADTDRTGFGRNAVVADINIVTAGFKFKTGAIAQGDIVVAGGVLKECRGTFGRVVAAGGVRKSAEKPSAVLLLPVVLLKSA